MVRSRDVVQAEGSARTEGARRATGVRADGAAAGAGSLAPGQRWSASRKRDVVLRLLRGESLEALSVEAGVEIYRRAGHGPRARLKGPSRRARGGGARRGEATHSRTAPRAGPGRGAAPPFGDLATMSATTVFRHPAGVSGGRRAAGAGTPPPAGRGAGAAGAAAEAIGPAAAGGDSDLASVPVPRRRPSQGHTLPSVGSC